MRDKSNQKPVNKIAHMQLLVTEGLKSGDYMVKKCLLAIIFTFVLLLGSLSHAFDKNYNILDEVVFFKNQYSLVLYFSRDMNNHAWGYRLVVKKNDETCFIGKPSYDYNIYLSEVEFVDISGDKVPEIIYECYGEGESNDNSIHIIRMIQECQFEEYDLGYTYDHLLYDVNKDGINEIILRYYDDSLIAYPDLEEVFYKEDIFGFSNNSLHKFTSKESEAYLEDKSTKIDRQIELLKKQDDFLIQNYINSIKRIELR